MYELREHPHTLMECPNCSKRALVRNNSEGYVCLWCNFHREIPHRRHRALSPARSNSGVFFFIIAAIIFGLIIL